MWDYTEKVMDLFHNPRNMGKLTPTDCGDGEALAVGEMGSIVCGDALRLYLRIHTATDQILDARFQTFGCASAIASSSALTEILKGKTLDEALHLSNRDIAQFLGGLPEEKMHCSVMGQEALESAIANYRGIPLETHAEDESPLVCQCFGVSRDRIRRVIIDNHLTTAEQVTNYIKAGGGCGSCLAAIEDAIAAVLTNQDSGLTEASPQPKAPSPSRDTAVEIALQDPPPPATHPVPPRTTVQKIALIQQVLDAEVRPLLLNDGGDVELYDVDGQRVQVILQGTCDGCPSSKETLKLLIEETLRDRVDPALIVDAVHPAIA